MALNCVKKFIIRKTLLFRTDKYLSIGFFSQHCVLVHNVKDERAQLIQPAFLATFVVARYSK